MIELKINEKRYTGFKKVKIKRSINCFASSFELTISDKLKNQATNILLGSLVEILIDKAFVITGFLDEIIPRYDANTHEITFIGRSKTADLVDCSTIFDTGQIIKSPLKEIIKAIIKPFNLNLKYLANLNPLVDDFQINQGESVSSTIEKLISKHNLIYYDDPYGNLVVDNVTNKANSGIFIHQNNGENNNNILSGSCSYSEKERYSDYIIKSQSNGSDFNGGENITSITSRVKDNDINRYRPLIMVESSLTEEEANKKCEYEKMSRIGKSFAIDYKVASWYNTNNKLYEPNSYVEVIDDFIKVSGKLIITDVDFELDENSPPTTTLHISPPEAFMSLNKKQTTYKAWDELKDGVK